MQQDPYHTLAKMYDRLCEPSANLLRKIGLQVFPPRENISILDIGCGTGTQLTLYRSPGCRLFGVDTSEAMLTAARRKLGEGAELRREDASSLRFPRQDV